MTNVHGISVAGGTFPARSGGCSWRRRSRTSRRRDFPLPNTYPTYKDWHGEWQYSGGSYVPTPDYSAPVRRRDDDDDDGAGSAGEDAREGEEEEVVAAASPTTAAPDRRRRRRQNRRLSPRPTWAALAAGLAVLGLTAAAVMLAWPNDSPLVPRHGGHPIGDTTWAWLFLGLLVAAFVAYVGGVLLARSSPPRLAAVAVDRVRGATRAARGAAAPLHRRLGLLGLRPDRGGSRCESVSRRARRVSERSGLSLHRARTGAIRRPCTGRRSRLPRSRSPALPARPPTRPRGSTSRLPPSCVLATAALAARLSRRSALALAFVGWNPLLAVHFAGGGHNDALLALLVVGALAAGAAGRRQLAGVCWALSLFVKWIPLLLLPLRAIEARAQHRRVGHLGFAIAAVVAPGRLLRALRDGVAARLRAARAQREPRDELGVAASARAARGASRRLDRALRGGVRGGVCVACAGSAAGKRAPRPRDMRAPARGSVPRRLVRRAGAPARSGGGRRACSAALARAVRVPPAPDDSALRASYGGSTRWNTSTASRSNTSRQAGLRRSHTTCVAVGSGASRSAYPGRASSTATHVASWMNGKLSTRRRAERCAPSEFVALTTAFGGISLERAAATRSCSAHDGRARLKRLAPGQLAPDRNRAEHVVADQRRAERRPSRPAARKRPRTRAPPSTAAAISGGISAAV